jgi:signal transduction histidine kinase
MRVCLVSADSQLREVVSEVVGPESFVAAAPETPAEADFHIWDFDVSRGWPKVNDLERQNQLFLVDRRELNDFDKYTNGAPVSMLLKPVSPRTLKAYLDTYSDFRGTHSEREDVRAVRSDRDILLRHLLQANLKLQEYDHERTEFLARALHDFRTPLMALDGFCDMLLAGEAGPLTRNQIELLTNMQNCRRRLARLTSGMFEMCVQGRVQRPLATVPGDIEYCLQQAVAEMGAVVKEKRLRIVSHVTSPGAPLWVDSHQIEQLLINLLENACRFSPRGGEIVVRGYPVHWNSDSPETSGRLGHSNAYRVDVHDAGPGVASELLEQIFEQYASYSGGTDRTGGGLGLAICKFVVTAHGGRIWATSSDGGATFSFVLPLEVGSPAAGSGSQLDPAQNQSSRSPATSVAVGEA